MDSAPLSSAYMLRRRLWIFFRSPRGLCLLDGLLAMGMIGAVLWFCFHADAILQHTWRWDTLLDYIIRTDANGNWQMGLLARGLMVTVRLSLWSLTLALLLGIGMGVFAARRKGLILWVTQIYVNLMRNTPPLVLLFLIYFLAGDWFLPLTALDDAIRLLPPMGREVIAVFFAPQGQAGRMAAAVLTLALYEGAYIAEIVRAGLESVPRGQWDAAAALGFSPMQSLRLVCAPQAMRLVLPPLAGQAVSIIKDSALASLISIPELTFQGMEVMATSRMSFEVWGTVTLLYLALALICTRVFARIERRLPATLRTPQRIA